MEYKQIIENIITIMINQKIEDGEETIKAFNEVEDDIKTAFDNACLNFDEEMEM